MAEQTLRKAERRGGSAASGLRRIWGNRRRAYPHANNLEIFIRARIALLVIAGGLVSLLIIGYGNGLANRIRNSQALWSTYDDRAIAAEASLHEIVGAIGYGGFIHNFKNYVLRPDDVRAARVAADIEALEAAIGSYERLSSFTPEEAIAVAALRSTVDDYAQKFVLARTLAAQGLDAEAIDAQVQISDAAALAALDQLADHAIERRLAVEADTNAALAETVAHLSRGVVFIPIMLVFIGFNVIFLRQTFAYGREAQHARDRLDKVLDAAPTPILLIGKDGRIARASNFAAKFFGYSRSKLETMTVTELIPERFRDGHDRHIRVFHDEGATRSLDQGRDIIALTADGREAPVDIALNPVRDNGESYVAAIIRDVSQQKDFEAAITAAKDAAEHANRAKGLFLATMSHEIRTPMNGVMGMLDLLLKTDLDETQRDRAAMARDSAHSLLTILNDVLDFSKLDAGQVHVESLPLDASQISNDVASLLSASADDKGLTLTYAADANVPTWTAGDPTRIRQVLMNLVGNAIKFTERGGVSVRVSYETSPSGGRLRFDVRDTGIGIPLDAQPQLFQRFAQADSSTTRKFGGTGLGLAISKQLVELMGGEIGVDSALGEGAVFWFTIPAEPCEAPQRAQREPEAAAPSAVIRPLKILIAEDHPTNQILVRTLLEPAGHDLQIVNNGVEAVEAVKRESFDLVLMDVQMPEMDGIAATRIIRAMPDAASGVPIIALTANVMSGDREKYLAAGMTDYVSKPISFPALSDAIARAANDSDCVDEATPMKNSAAG